MQCAQCESAAVETEWLEDPTFKVKVPVRRCRDCAFSYTDQAAEAVRTKAQGKCRMPTDDEFAAYVHENLELPPEKVRHADLARFSDSLYKSECPFCLGLLLMHRDRTTFALLRKDRCTLCARAVEYTDDSVNGEPFA